MDTTTEICSIRSVATGNGVTIHVEGELDIATAPRLTATLAGFDGEVDTVVVDLSGTTFCDGAGLRVFEETRQRLGERFQVRDASPLVRRVAAIVGMEWVAADGTAPARHYGDEPS
jgi:anti-anti-sigma factor